MPTELVEADRLALVASMLSMSSGCDYSANTQFKPESTKKAPPDYNSRVGIKIASEVT